MSLPSDVPRDTMRSDAERVTRVTHMEKRALAVAGIERNRFSLDANRPGVPSRLLRGFDVVIIDLYYISTEIERGYRGARVARDEF